MTERTRTFYRVITQVLDDGEGRRQPYWRDIGSGPGGPTLEAAYNKIREEVRTHVSYHGPESLDHMRYEIEEVITITRSVDIMPGTEVSFLMLRP